MANKQGRELNPRELSEEIEGLMMDVATNACHEDIDTHGHLHVKEVVWTVESLKDTAAEIGLEYSEEQISDVLNQLLRERKLKIQITDSEVFFAWPIVVTC